MLKNTLLHIIIFIIAYLPTLGQTKQFDTLQSIESVYYSSQIILPAYYKELSQKLKLPSIEKNTDSFSLRLWTASMFGYELSVLRKKGTWESHKYKYYDSANLKEIELKPQISISSLADSLRMINFERLVTQNKIENFRDDIDDGVTYTLEISYNNSYRIFQYHNPESFAKREPNNKIFLNIVKLLNKYFR